MSIWKKKLLLLTISVFILFPPLITAQAEGTVYEQYQKNPQQEKAPETQAELNDVSVFPYLLKFIGSLLFIIFILYIVQKYLIKNRKLNQNGGPFHAIGGHSLGSNRSMQMVMVGDTLYILGVGENVNLIRTIPPGEEQRQLLKAVAEAETPVDAVTKWGTKILNKTKKEKWKETFLQQLKEVIPNHNKDKGKKEDDESKKGGID